MLRTAFRCHLAKSAGVQTRALSSAATKQQFEDFPMKKFCWHTPEEGHVRTSPFKDIEISNLMLDQFVWKDFNKWHSHTAIVCGATNRQYTYAQLRDHSAAMAVRLQTKLGTQHGDTLAICLPNIPEFPIAAFGSIEAGLVVTTVNPIYTAEEISRQLVASRATILIGTVGNHSVLTEAIRLAQKPIRIVCIRTVDGESVPNGAIDFAQLVQPDGVDFSTLRKYDRSADDLAFLPFSSGTTGMPKGVKLSHQNITANCGQIQVNLPHTPLVAETRPDFQEVIPSVLPFFHIYGLTVLMISKMAIGTKIVSLPSFHPDTFLGSLVKHKASILHLVPPIVLFLAANKMVKPEMMSSVHSIMSGAAPIGALDAARLAEKAPHVNFIQGYGLTESSPVVLMNVKNSARYASIGGTVPYTEAKIVDINDTDYKGLAANQQGELLVRGPQVMKGYLNNDAATAETIVRGGWMRTGDLGHYDDDGYFYITDRLKELIKVKGFQVPPAELEEILRNHPDVADAAVVGAMHEHHGEVPRAFIVKKEGSTVSEQVLKDYVASKVAVYKRLEGGVKFLDAIPKNASGKILRRQLKCEEA